MTDEKRALIIFARRPEAGKVKTRLAAALGEAKALEIYIKLLHHTKVITKDLPCHKYVFLTREPHGDFWSGFNTELQQGATLGDRMQHAFESLFTAGMRHVMIIGSDCPGLHSDDILDAFRILDSHNVAIGPTYDGGYYLLAMDSHYPSLFQNKIWSSGGVFADTMQDIEDANLSCQVLRRLSDVDVIEDVPQEWL